MVKNPKNTNAKQKIALAVLFVLALLVVFFWSSSLKNKLAKPFEINKPTDNSDSVAFCPGGNCPEATEENSKIKDTDKDGLSDWDELNIYNTSPYLEDTDSDGVDDRIEVISGSDPTCIDDNCNQNNSALAEGTNPEKEEDFLLDSLNDEELGDIITSQESAELLREALLSSGMDEETLNSISDEDLLAGYLEMLSNQ